MVKYDAQSKSVWFLAVNVSLYYTIKCNRYIEINAIFNIFLFHCINEKIAK